MDIRLLQCHLQYMRETDGRRLDHQTLEQIRTRAFQRVQAGESPEVVVRALVLRERRFTTGSPSEAARAVGLLADYLERNPGAIVRRRDASQE